MTKILNQAFALASSLDDDRQDEIGWMLISVIEQERSPLRLWEDQTAEVRRHLANPDSIASTE